MLSGRVFLRLWLVAAVFLISARLSAQEKKPDLAKLPEPVNKTVDFVRDIQPIFQKTCYSCHGPEEQESGLRLDVKGRALEGGDGGKVIVPGNSAESLLIQMVAGIDEEERLMPPEGEGTPLDKQRIALLRAWIDQGAKWPESADLATDKGADHWSFQPIARPMLPAVKNTAWVRNEIDYFILARLEKEAVQPSPEADRVTLMRRAYFDLLGLPPTPAEVDAFLSDTRPGAYERLADRLLASPHYGERWGRHWLDLSRYADSDGYEKDRSRPHAWRYRSWVIAALNADMSFDEFTIEQIAGDLLPGATTDQRIATGFHRNTLHNTEGGIDKEEDRVKKTVDRINTIGTIWMGLTVGCCQCHSHKYDPLTQREYYQLYAMLNSIDEKNIDAPLPGPTARYQQAKAVYDAAHSPLQAAVAKYEKTKLPAAQVAWEKGPGDLQKLPEAIRNILAVAADDRTGKQREQLAKHYRTVDAELVKLIKAAAEHAKQAPKPPDLKAQTVVELAKPRETKIHIRGDFLSKGEPVEPDVPAVLPAIKPRYKRPDRLDLARWLVDPNNPLTARVSVNRLWQHYFGRGIVLTNDDFGTKGTPPTHPELLDWLASELARDWSLKRVHRRIVTSSTYRQSSTARPKLREKDPDNELLARQNRRRVESEIVRDVSLAVSGLLQPRLGGPSVRPPQAGDYSKLTYAMSAKWSTSSGPDQYRRGLYTFFKRTSPYPMLVTFDSPDSNTTCARRSSSNTPLQSLTLWNDPVFFECAQSLGRRIIREVPADEDAQSTLRRRAAYAFRLCMARHPSEAELGDMIDLYKAQIAISEQDQKAAHTMVGKHPLPEGAKTTELAGWVIVGRTLLNLDEFITKE